MNAAPGVQVVVNHGQAPAAAIAAPQPTHPLQNRCITAVLSSMGTLIVAIPAVRQFISQNPYLSTVLATATIGPHLLALASPQGITNLINFCRNHPKLMTATVITATTAAAIFDHPKAVTDALTKTAIYCIDTPISPLKCLESAKKAVLSKIDSGINVLDKWFPKQK